MSYNRQTDAWPTTDRQTHGIQQTDRCMDVLTDRGPDRRMAYNRQADACPTIDRQMHVLQQTGACPTTDRQTHVLQQTDRRMS